MVNMIGLIITTALVTFIGGGIGYLIWVRTRPKKETWNARVYQLTEGTQEVRISKKDGSILSQITLKDLKPYASDKLEKIEKAPGITIYRLQKLNIPTPAVEGDVVEYWGKENREVTVVLHKGSATILKKGYDAGSGQMVFSPLPHSRINILKSEIAMKKDRLQKEKDILTAITPWIVAGICMLGLTAIAYIQIDGAIQVANSAESSAGAFNAMHQRELAFQLRMQELRSGVPVNYTAFGVSDKTAIDQGWIVPDK